MKRFDKPEDYSRDWARGVCMSVERMTGTQPRRSSVWPRVLSVAAWIGITVSLVLISLSNVGAT